MKRTWKYFSFYLLGFLAHFIMIQYNFSGILIGFVAGALIGIYSALEEK